MFLVILIPAFVFHTFALLVVRSGDAFLLFVALRDQKTGDRTALPYDDGHVLARDRVSATTRPVQPTVRARRIRPYWPSAWNLGNLGSPTISVHATNQSTRRSRIGGEWHHGRSGVDRDLLQNLERRACQSRKSLARLP